MQQQQQQQLTQQQQQQQLFQQQKQQSSTRDVGKSSAVVGGGITSLAAQHAATKLSGLSGGVSTQQAGVGVDTKSGASSTKTSPHTSRSNSFSSNQGPFEGSTQIKDPAPTPAAVPTPSFSRPVSSRGHMLPQSAQMISEKERQREAELEHIFTPQIGQIIAERYEFIKLLGRGTFSQVLQCRDLVAPATMNEEDMMEDVESAASSSSSSSNSNMVTIPLKAKNIVAIKVIRDVARYRHAAEKEARILQHLAATKHQPYHPAQPALELQTARGMQQDSRIGVYGVNPLLGWFRMGGHFCMVFPPLGCSLYDFLRANRFAPLFPHHIKHIAQQLLTTCAGLHQIGVVHADIKPGQSLTTLPTIHIQQAQPTFEQHDSS